MVFLLVFVRGNMLAATVSSTIYVFPAEMEYFILTSVRQAKMAFEKCKEIS